jgi:hypothetical protein
MTLHNGTREDAEQLQQAQLGKSTFIRHRRRCMYVYNNSSVGYIYYTYKQLNRPNASLGMLLSASPLFFISLFFFTL